MLRWYYELSSRRQVTMAGAQAISYQEVVAWMICKGHALLPMELDVIMKLDDIYREDAAERARREARKQEQKQLSASAKAGRF